MGEDKRKVRHHDHLTGKFKSATCNNCNLQLRLKKSNKKEGVKQYDMKKKSTSDEDPTPMQTVIRNVDDNLELIEAEKGEFSKDDEFFLPVIIHNLKGYDSYLILKHMRTGHMILSVKFATVDEDDEVVVEKVKDIFIIATNSEKYMGFQIGQVRFIDLMQFLNSSLVSLISTVVKDGMDKFIYTKRYFPDMGQFELVTRKGVFPYEWFDSAERFEETSFPVQDMF